MGTKEEVKKHEPDCYDNYDKKGCTTCKHKKILCNPTWRYECKNGVDIPEGKMFTNCSSYERKENHGNLFDDFWRTILTK